MRHILPVALVVPLLTAPAFADFYSLRDYARMGNLWGVVRELISGSSPNRPSYEDGYTPLMFAAGNGQVAMTRMLLAAGAEVDVRDHNGDRALLWAAQRRYPETVAVLLEAGAVAQSPDDPYGKSPLMQASWYGPVESVRLLLDAGADPNALDQSNETALHYGALSQSTEIVAALLDAGADATVIGEILLQSPLHIAAPRENAEIVRLLIAAGSAIEAVDSDGETPLSRAAMVGNVANAAALIDAGADPDGGKNIPILAALTPVNADYGDHNAVARLLAPLTRRLDVAFATAVWAGNAEVADILFSRGASANAVDEWGRPALAGAVNRAGTAMFDALLERGAEVAQSGPQAMIAAAGQGRADLVLRLLALGVSVDARSEVGSTPLLEAAAGGQVEMVSLLLAHGADAGLTDNLGRGAADYMAIPVSFIEARIDTRSRSRAWRPTEHLEIELADLSGRHAEIRVLLGIETTR
jgi:ankyrin repeat protein